MPRRYWTLILTVAMILAPRFAHAEPYAGLFAGAAFTERSDVKDLIGLNFKDVRFDTSFVGGGKVGIFFEPPVLSGNFGLELEVSHFRPDIDQQTVTVSGRGFSGERRFPSADVQVTPIVLSALYRLPLARDESFPRGRIHPYVGVGVGAFIANFSTRTQIVNLGTFDDTDVRPGFQGLAGLRFFLTPHVAVFGEYKYVRASDFDFKLTSDLGTFNGAAVVEIARFKLDLTTHMLQAGFAYHW